MILGVEEAAALEDRRQHEIVVCENFLLGIFKLEAIGSAVVAIQRLASVFNRFTFIFLRRKQKRPSVVQS